MSAPVEWGPARYRIVARWSCDGIITRGASYVWGPALLGAVRDLVELRGDPLTALCVEPVAGTEYRATYGDVVGGWWRFDAETLHSYVAGCRPLSKLELRSPVQS